MGIVDSLERERQVSECVEGCTTFIKLLTRPIHCTFLFIDTDLEFALTYLRLVDVTVCKA